jgi:hypothetical protein
MILSVTSLAGACRRLLPGMLACLLATFAAAAEPPALRDGDLVFQTSRSAQSQAIQRATDSPYSHVGMVLLRGGKPYVVEAEGRVQETPLAQWIARGEGGHFVVSRLRDADRRLDGAARQRLRTAAARYAGRRYDALFAWSDERLYCSELVWKIYRDALGVEVGTLQRLRDFRLDDPLVRGALQARYGQAVPWDEPVISPAAIHASPLLMKVIEQ